MSFQFAAHGRIERDALRLSGIGKSFDEQLVLVDVNLLVERGQKVGAGDFHQHGDIAERQLRENIPAC